MNMSLLQPDTQLNREEDEGIELFNLLYAAFQRANSAIGETIELFYHIGGHTICLRFAGDALISRITPAFNHLLAAPTTSPDLTICLWDRASTGIRMTLLSKLFRYMSWHWQESVDGRGELKGFNSERIRAALHPGPNIVSVLDLQQNLALYWVENAEQIVWFETGSPLQKILHWWMAQHKRQFVHAGAVGTSDGGVLLVGKGGTGKSTTTLACLQSGLSYVGDDYCLIATEPSPYVYSLYNTAKLKGDEDLARFPHLTGRVYNPARAEDEKIMLFLYDHCPDKVVKGLPLQAILLPQVTGQIETTLKSTTSGLALGALAPSTIVQLPGAGQTALRMMSQLVKQVPCYILKVGTDLHNIPGAILKVLSRS